MILSSIHIIFLAIMEKSKFQNGKKPNFEYKIQKHPANIG